VNGGLREPSTEYDFKDQTMRRWLLGTMLMLGLAAAGPLASPVQACPMCKAANESDQNGEVNTKPRAYMYSILFMLAMPATLLGAYGLVFWRATRGVRAPADPPLDGGA
jgi:hypothetical protein